MNKCFKVVYDDNGFAKAYCNEIKIVDNTLVLDGQQVIDLKQYRSINIARIPLDPDQCSSCGQMDVHPFILPEYSFDFKLEDKMHKTTVHNLHVLKCYACGEIFFISDTDYQMQEAILKYKAFIGWLPSNKGL